MTRCVVVDYGIGNLLSATRALEACGADVVLTGDPEEVRAAGRLVLPGVGAFGRCMESLRGHGLAEPVGDVLRSGRPVLGICVGMQMLLEFGLEFGRHRGLGLLPGTVEAIPSSAVDGGPLKVPHVGWSELETAGQSWDGTILDGVRPGGFCYFVHSFVALPARPEHRLADVVYGGHRLCAVLRSGQVYGTQFHPEKSGRLGLAILRNFLAIPGRPERAASTPLRADAVAH